MRMGQANLLLTAFAAQAGAIGAGLEVYRSSATAGHRIHIPVRGEALAALEATLGLAETQAEMLLAGIRSMRAQSLEKPAEMLPAPPFPARKSQPGQPGQEGQEGPP